MTITASQVKELRDKTGAGMMDCQRALKEAAGDSEEAVKLLRKKGLAAAAKKAGRAAKDGLVVVAVSQDERSGAMVEVNCETDFVARNEQYQAFARQVAEQAMSEAWPDAAAGLASPWSSDASRTVEQTISSQIATIGENIVLTRATSLQVGDGMKLGSYVHMGGKIGVLVEISTVAGEETVKDVAMHIAAAEPRYVTRDMVPASEIADERDIARAQVPEGKPEQVIEKIIEGKLGKYFEQVCLLEQPFVKNPDETVAALLERDGATVRSFLRFRLGEAAAAGQE